VLWITSATLLGYLLASVVPDIDHYLQYVIGAIIFLSILPPLIEWLKSRKSRASVKA
jgi:membrane-associated protein